MKELFKEKKLLKIPGPTPIPTRVVRAMEQPMIGHRSTDFSLILQEVTRKCKGVFQTMNDLFVLTSSGTGGLETAVVNTISPGDKVLVASTGVFGERFAKLGAIYGARVEKIKTEPGRAVDPEAIRDKLDKEPDIKGVFVTHNETSTGVQNDCAAIGRILKERDALFIVDAVSSLGAVDIRTDEWGIDILVTGSQKAFMLPPGLAMINVSQKAWEVVNAVDTPRFYFDLRAMRDRAPKQTPFTPNVTLTLGLLEALNMIEEEGLTNIFRRHEIMQTMTRSAFKAMGLELLAEDDCASKTVTAVKGPKGLNVDGFRKVLDSKYNISIAGGQGDLKGKIFRVAHMGYTDYMETIMTIAGIELALKDMGYPVELAVGVRKAQEVLINESPGS